MSSIRPDSQGYLKLLEISKVRAKISSEFKDYGPETERIRLDQALGRVLAEDIVAEEDLPPTTISAMDGYAVRHSAIVSASPSNPSEFKVRGALYPKDIARPAGLLPSIEGDSDAYYVATGAPIPRGCDVVARIEETRIDQAGKKVLVSREIPRWKNISLKGEDIRAGDHLFRERRVLNSSDAATLIGLGKREVRVYARPRVGILSIGSELVEFDPSAELSANGRTINNYANLIAGYLAEYGADPIPLGVVEDEQDRITTRIGSSLETMDMVITIAGSSVGAKDYVPNSILALENSRLLFHGVRAVPIRPAGLGIVIGKKKRSSSRSNKEETTTKKKAIAIIPGHAVSAALTFFVIVLPVLNLLSGLEMESRQVVIGAVTETEFQNDRGIDALCLVQVKSRGPEREYFATQLEWGSNLLSNLSKAHGFVWLAPHERIARSERVRVQLLGSSELARIQ